MYGFSEETLSRKSFDRLIPKKNWSLFGKIEENFLGSGEVFEGEVGMGEAREEERVAGEWGLGELCVELEEGEE